MRFTYFLPGWMVVLGIGVVIGITVYVYFRIARPLHPRYRLLLILLRIAAASILLGCLLAPVVIEKKDITPPTHLSILVDTSRSMQLVDVPMNEIPLSRLSQVNQLLFNVPGQFLQTLHDRFEVHLYPFDTRLQQSVLLAQEGDSPMPPLEAEGTLTDIGGAIREAGAAWKGQQTAGMVLFTDGAHNSGQFPLEMVTALEVPIYPIGVGSVEPPKDIQIQRVDYTPIAYTNHESVIRVSVMQTGYTGKTTQLSLREVESQNLVDTATLTFNPSEEIGAVDTSTKQVVELKLAPQWEGSFQYSVTLPTLDGELTEENNQKTFSLKVVKAKLNVFYLEGRPRWDYTFLKRTLERDPDIEATCAVLSRKGGKPLSVRSLLDRLDGYYPQATPASETPRFPETLAELSKYDVLILGDLGAEHFTETQQRAIVDFVETQGKPVIFLPSRNMLGVNGLGSTELAPLLPIDIPRNGCRVEDTEFTVQLTQSGAFHPMLQLDDAQVAQTGQTAGMDGGNLSLWRNMPALSRSFSGFRLRGGATTLMENGRGMPILILQRTGLGKSLIITAEGFWNWDFGVTTYRDTRYHTIYPRFWAQVIRWMATNTDDKNVYLTTDASTYAIGDTVKVAAYLYSETYQPQAGATVQIEVVPPDGVPFQVSSRQQSAVSSQQSAVSNQQETVGSPENLLTDNPINLTAMQTDNHLSDMSHLYTAQFALLQKGKYRIRATGRSGNLKLGEDQIDIFAHPQLAELENPQLNEDLLKQLAERTGGTYFTMANAESVPENIANVQNPIFVDAERELWAHPLILITVVGLLGAEWFLRKRIGLL
ncbi:hypothetical protein C6500_16265 [Candidatus Poribacteria bacterium]|nr:MAG: hypothetical protein C6500_16265 [Candidatus Poribacteria bacterium]